MKMLAPAAGFTSLKNEMDRLFEKFWDGDFAPPFLGEWLPPLDLMEGLDAVTVAVDVPGFEPKDIHVTLREAVLTIRGERKTETERKDEKVYRTERSSGSFTRMVRLPVAVDGNRVQATFKNGVLTIVMPKSPEARGTDIPVKIA